MTDNTHPTTVAFRVDGMTCGSCVRRVGATLNTHFDGLSHQVELETKRLVVTFDPREASVEAIARVMDDAGYPLTAL